MFKNPFKLQRHNLTVVTPYIILIAAVLAAWFPVLGGSPLIVDDYPFTLTLKNGLYTYLENWFASGWGVLRVLGQIINGFNTNHPILCSFLAVFTHILTVCLFFRVCQILLKSTKLSLTLALVMGIFPWGYQSIVQVAGYVILLTTTIFWANLLLLLTFSQNRKIQTCVFCISFCLTLIANLNYENSVFAFIVSGLIVWIDEKEIKFYSKYWINNVRNKISGFAPALASLIYLVLFKLTVNTSVISSTLGRTTKINPGSVLSTYYYQYTNLYIFQPWFNANTRNLIFFSWNLSKILLFLFLLCILIMSLITFLRQDKIQLSTTKLDYKLLFYIVGLLLGASFIYALAGGYTIDTRKKYALIPLMLLMFGWIWRNFFEPRFQISRRFIAILMTLALFGISTTWLVVGVYRYEVMRQDALATFLAANNISGSIKIDFNPDIRSAWPTMPATLGFDMWEDWSLTNSLKAKSGRLCCKILINFNWLRQDPYAVYPTNNPDALKLRFEPNDFHWQIVRL